MLNTNLRVLCCEAAMMRHAEWEVSSVNCGQDLRRGAAQRSSLLLMMLALFTRRLIALHISGK